jgi:cyclohexyl-isocyanide hydratase
MKFLPDLSWRTCATKAMITDSFGLHIRVDQITPDLSEFDAIFIPGGLGSRALQKNDDFIAWLKTAQTVPWKISVCTGSLLLGAAGFLANKRATTHFDEYETLAPYCSEVVKERIVADGQLITGGAVATSLDLGLYICERWASADAARAIQTRMHYKP